MNPLEKIQRQIQWNRLIAVVEEQAQVMIRTAFSTTVREAGDLSAGVFDLQGRMLAQAVTGTPGHVNSMMESVGHFLAKFPAATMREGDHYITNDPWLGTGHLHDLTVVSPAFHHGKIVGLFANTAHIIDIGGLGMGPEGRSVFEEGLYIPIVKCFEAGKPNETFFDFIRVGSRTPVELEGDIYSLCACNDAGAKRLAEMLDEYALEGLDSLAAYIFDASLTATQAAINALPRGTFHNSINSDGYEAPVTLRAALTVAQDEIVVDYAGTSGLSNRGIKDTSEQTVYAYLGDGETDEVDAVGAGLLGGPVEGRAVERLGRRPHPRVASEHGEQLGQHDELADAVALGVPLAQRRRVALAVRLGVRLAQRRRLARSRPRVGRDSRATSGIFQHEGPRAHSRELKESQTVPHTRWIYKLWTE
jgi:hypothetical protein